MYEGHCTHATNSHGSLQLPSENEMAESTTTIEGSPAVSGNNDNKNVLEYIDLEGIQLP